MLRITVLGLLALSCSCQDVIEVSGAKVANKNVPLATSSGVAPIRPFPVPVAGQAAVSGSPVVSSYGVGGLESVHNNLAYLQSLRSRILGQPSFYGSAIGTLGSHLGSLGNSVNIAPSVLSSIPFGQAQSYYGVNQPQQFAISQPASYAISQPASFAFAQQQPSIAIQAQPALGLAVHRGSVAVAQPQVYGANLQNQVHPVNAAITQVARTVEYRAIPYQDQPIVPQEVVVEPSDQPINIHFRSRSSTVRISQEHIPGEPGEIQQTQSQDDASRVQHEVVKPVVQEVKEIIQPYRQVTQEINPVVENVHTIVTHGEGQRAQYVAEPIVRQQLLAVRPQVQQFAVPAVQPVAVQRSVAVSQPVVQQFQAVRPLSYFAAQPAIQSVGVQAFPSVQALAVPRGQIAISQPSVSGYQYAQPAYGLAAYRGTVAVNQPVVGVNRVVAVSQPGAVVRQEVREVRPGQLNVQRGSDFIRYAESD